MSMSNGATGETHQSGDDSTRSERKAGRKQALAELRSATRELHGTASKLYRRNRLDDEDIRRLQAVLKEGARVRRRGISAIREVIADYHARAERLRDLVPEKESASQNGSSEKEKHSDSDGGTSERASKDAVPPTSVAQAHGTQLPATNGKDSSEFRIDERTDEQLELVAKRRRLVRLQIEDGMTAREALEEVGLDCTPRSARMLKQKFQEQGILGIVDKRWLRRPERSVLVKEVQVLIKKWYAGRRAAGPTAIARKVRKECRERDLPEPSDSAVRTFLDELPRVEKLFLRDQLDEWDQQGRPVVRVERAHRANEIWQIDHTTLNIWVRLRCGEEWIAVRPYLTGIVDVYSRSIPGFFVSTAHPDAWSVTLAVRHAVSTKTVDSWFNHGLPDRVQHDQGSDFMSHMLQGWFTDQNVEVDPNPPNYPNETGIVERYFETLDRGCLRLLPGHIDAVGTSKGAAHKQIDRLLTRQQLKDEITRFIVEEYHHWHHREIDSKPAIRWEEGMGIPRMPAQGDLNSLILKHPDERTVTKTGIRFNIDGRGGRYWCPSLCEHWKRTVRIGYNPEDLESVLVYASDTGEYLCEAWIMGQDDSKYDIGDIKKFRNQFRRGLKQRTAKYRREVEEEDRRKAREVAAREMAEKVETDGYPSNPPEDDEHEEEVEQLMDDLNRAMGE